MNLLCGVIAVMLAATDHLVVAAFFVLIGILFDFLDGFVARILKVQSDLGIQLDSLADMVTSGVVPGVVMFQLLNRSSGDWSEFNWFSYLNQANVLEGTKFEITYLLPFIGLLLTLGACYRLANFNLDTSQTNSFIGLPTPAMTLFVISLPLIHEYSESLEVIEFIDNKIFLIVVTLVLVILMNSKLHLFSLKLKNFSLKENFIQLIFLVITIILLIVFKVVGIPLIILLYIVFSLFKN